MHKSDTAVPFLIFFRVRCTMVSITKKLIASLNNVAVWLIAKPMLQVVKVTTYAGIL